METTKTRELLVRHCKSYPNLQIRDIFKFIFQSSFGCEHLVSSQDKAIEYIENEYKNNDRKDDCRIEELDGDYCRVPLSYLDKGLSANTLGKLFALSAKKEENGFDRLNEKIDMLTKLVKDKTLPFQYAEFEEQLTEWKKQGFPAIHHSDVFRSEYKPSYRVVSKTFIPFLPLFATIDIGLAKGNIKVAIEGGSASGKSTLGDLLSSVYDCTLFHMDDFFLRPEQRTAERFSEIGGNVDRERFHSEVLMPMSRGENICYRRFDCKTMTLMNGQTVIPKALTVIEGAYSMHPDLAPYYDLSVFLDISADLQRDRILVRNTPNMAERFFNEWIPLEKRYFENMHVKDRCDLVITIK